VSIVDLGEAGPIDGAVQAARMAIASSADRSREIGEPRAEQLAKDALQKVGDLVLKPLTPHLKDVKTLIISPDGDLWLAPWAALPYSGDRYLVESMTPRLVLSGRDLVKPASAAKIETAEALVVADPDYNAAPVASPVRLAGMESIGRLADFDATFVFGEAGKLTVRVPEGDIIGSGTWKQTGDTVQMETERSIYAGSIIGTQLRGERRIKDMNGAPDAFAIELAELNPTKTVPGELPFARQLPLTRPEGEAAASRLKAITGAEPRLLTSAKASEAAVKGTTRPKALVLATHGYFFPSPKDGVRVNDPLARGGILLAGCNQRAKAGPGQEDGILTGLEVVALDLRGTTFVVLSACDTGVGETVSGEGVAGLRQAFQLAGADDVLSTLWPIPDAETGRLMGRFYDRLASGLTRAEVLAAAQREAIQDRRKRMASAHPYYWAALTLTGRE
jgi:CHAT domain-containing protein